MRRATIYGDRNWAELLDAMVEPTPTQKPTGEPSARQNKAFELQLLSGGMCSMFSIAGVCVACVRKAYIDPTCTIC